MIAFLSVLYDPPPNAIKNIELASKNGFFPLVYLNRVDEFLQSKLDEYGVIKLGQNINVGLGVAFKEAEQYLIENHCNYYIYFDQDTIVSDLAWKKILKTCEYSFKKNGIGLLFFGYLRGVYPKLVVSSGSVFSLELIKKYGGHKDTFFVEGVDYDYCITLDENNLKILYFEESEVDHFTLQDNEIIEIYGFKFKYRVYGKSRTKDFNLSHSKLIKRCIKNKRIRLGLFFIKSVILFNLYEFGSELLRRRFK